MHKRRTFNDAGHAHELTFSVYRRTNLFDRRVLCEAFLERLDAVRREFSFEIWAYVLMPDHVHLLVWPKEQDYDVSGFRRSLKQPFSRHALSHLRLHGDDVLLRLGADRDGAPHRPRIWQKGAGYDRNVHSTPACKKSMDYIHDNPVVAGLAAAPWEYEWSSAGWYEGRRPVPFEVDRARY